MKIINETELMKNQKASSVVMPDKQFEALQTIEGNTLLFSIGTDNILYCTREVPGDMHGWVRVDLSSLLSAACYNGATVSAKTFDIAQDLSNVNTVDIALVVTVNGKDHLHLATGFTNTLANWAAGTPSFTQYPFDDYKNPSFAALPISDVLIADGNGSQFIIADVISNTTTQTISRYYIDTSKTAYVDSNGTGYAWVPHNLSIDLQAGQVTTLLGCGPSDGPNNGGSNIGGVYVLGKIGNTPQLMYAPTYNYADPAMIQNPTIINLPAGTDASHMAIGLSAPAANAPYSDLFFATNGRLHFLANANQIDAETSKPTPVSVYQHSLFQDIQSMHVSNWNNNIVIWGQSLVTDGSGTSQLFIMEGVAGQETNTDAWSCPVPLLFNVENSASYVNNNYSADSAIDSVNGNAYGSCSVLFAHQADGSLVQLFQDPITTAWQQRSLLTVPNDYTVMYETTTYTSHINITDDNNVPRGSIPVSIWASSPCSVFVNNVYTALDNANALQTTADELGIINITQPVDTIGGISYYISVQDPVTKQVYNEAINPVLGTMASLGSNVPDSAHDYLGKVQVTDELGNSTPLVSSSISGSQTTAASANIYTVCQQNANVNKDGLVTGQSWPGTTVSAAEHAVKPVPSSAAKPAPPPAVKQVVRRTVKPDRLAKHIRFNPKTDKIWGCTFGKNAKHYEGIEAMKEMGLVLHPDGSLSFTQQNAGLGSFLNAIETKAGHLFKWMKSEAQKLEQAVITFTGGVIDCLLTIAGSVYHFVIKCANDIANAAHTFLNAVETAFEDVVKWLGSIFAWNDIIRTHKVLKTMFSTYAGYCIENISTAQAQLNYAAGQAISAIDNWAQLPASTFPQDTYPGQNTNVDQAKGQNSPSANWGHHQAGNNAANSNCTGVAAEIGDLLNDFFQAMEVEADIIIQAVNQLTGVLSNAASMPLDTLIRQIVAIIADVVINSTVNIADTLLTAAEQIVSDVVSSTLAAPIHIPVLSNLYKTFAGDELSILDLVCLIVAIPVNVIYKLANDKQAPFPDNASTTALINAATFNAFMQAAANVQTAPVSLAAKSKLGAPEVWSDAANKHWTFIGNCCALGGSIGVSLFGCLKIKFPKSYVVAVLYGACYLPYVAPDIIGVVQDFYNPQTNWYNYMNFGLATAGLIKSFVDIKLTYNANNPLQSQIAAAAKPAPKKLLVGADDDPPVEVPPVESPAPAIAADPGSTSGWAKPFANGYSWNDASPFVEAAVNLAWEVSVAFAYIDAKQQPGFDYKSNVLQCTGNTMFNFGGIISPFSTFGPSPANLIVAGIQVVMNLGYGAMVFASWYE